MNWNRVPAANPSHLLGNLWFGTDQADGVTDPKIGLVLGTGALPAKSTSNPETKPATHRFGRRGWLERIRSSRERTAWRYAS